MGLPQKPRLGAFRSARVPNVARFEPDIGPNLRRRRATATGTDITADMVITPAQKTTLDAFFEDDCKDGALSFNMIDWESQSEETFTWAQAPAYRLMSQGEFYTVTLNLRREP